MLYLNFKMDFIIDYKTLKVTWQITIFLEFKIME